MTPELTQAEVSELLSYEPESGVFRWKMDRRGGLKSGEVAGTPDATGYRQIKVKGVRYLAHRLAFLLMEGNWPSGQIDHKNGAKDDNRFENLRDVSSALNCQNKRKANKASTTGLLGVSPFKGRYMAQITVDGQKRHLGTYDSPHVAHAVYVAHKRLLHEGNTL